jgi:hypothetical protein
LEHGIGVGWTGREPEKSCVVRAGRAGMGDAGSEMPLAQKDRLRSDGSAVSVRSSHLDWKRVSNKCPLVSKRTPQEWV